MHPDLASAALRVALREQGIVISDADAWAVRGGRWALTLAPSLLVWCDHEHYRWPGSTGTWQLHPVQDPPGAALLLAALLAVSSERT